MAPALIQELDDEPRSTATIELTPIEATLKQLLLDVARDIDQHPQGASNESHATLPPELSNEPITLRFTGGWVRDKLLGQQSHDIDVAINKMTGYQFGLRLKQYLEIPGNPERYGLEGVATTDKQNAKSGTTDKSKTVGGLHKIEANPEKSKHLETVTTRILGLDIDLVNLRKETYTDESRNPQMEFGTPKEDALRRDATVNAMFYNLNTEEIEDFTGRGHDDMRDKILRTPLEPHQTFKDDPLRVLRLIRFASRLPGWHIDPEALLAMRNVDIKAALRRKISRERVGVELEKALQSVNPYEALRLIFDLGLYGTIFSDPTVELADHHEPDTSGWETMLGVLRTVLENDGPIASILAASPDEQYLAWQLAALVPYRDAPQPEPVAPGRKPPPPVAATVAREGIKTTNRVTDIVTASVRNQQEISVLVDRVYDRKRRPDKAVDGEDAVARDVLGMAVRRWGATWRSQVMYSFLVDVVENPGSIEVIERKYTTFVQHLQSLDLLEAYNLKPLLDGKALSKALHTPTGPWMKDALDVVMAWQLRHPGVTDPQAAIEEVKQKREGGKTRGGELSSALVHHFLKLTIRPLFAKSRPTTVTASGRKVETQVLPPKMTSEIMDDEKMKPWKSNANAGIISLLRWAVGALDETIVEEVWPLVVPPLLTLLDDYEVKWKQLGAELLQQLLDATPPSLLQRTGLDDVFEEALMPCLTWLPPIAPEAQSVQLLSAVYPALLTLCRARYSENGRRSSSTISGQNVQTTRIKFLDTILRKGIIQGFGLAQQYPGVVGMLFSQSIAFLNALGIETVKHLKYLMPMITDTLTHPGLVSAKPATLLATTKALQAVIQNSWPRMYIYRGEVLKATTICWLNTVELRDGTHEVEELGVALHEVVALLSVAFGGRQEFVRECETLVAADERLKDLFHAS